MYDTYNIYHELKLQKEVVAHVFPYASKTA